MKTITNKFKLALFAVGLFSIGTVNAQTTPANSGTANTTQANSAGPSIRLIDNKGTIKYIQSNNGITTITSTDSGNRTTTTWQLGGTLVENTYITAGTGTEFALNGLELLDGTAVASTNSQDRGAHDDGLGATGYTVLLRDEATGAVKKMQLSDLLEVQGGQEEFLGEETTAAAGRILIATATDIPGTPLGLNAGKVSVYRNGAKLRAGFDYTITDGATLSQLTLTNRSAEASPNDWTLYNDDLIEVHWIK
ncbi:hypothetical protein [Tenacibaculum crassostreae]|uniref:hypothetical protein n=1 Tax=Tenacibaculum crassostreae TaxID=502683 RepID=UPI003893456D